MGDFIRDIQGKGVFIFEIRECFSNRELISLSYIEPFSVIHYFLSENLRFSAQNCSQAHYITVLVINMK